ncbi:hypothetical protein MTO96_033406 [Rhipicephalus appendiculatus]
MATRTNGEATLATMFKCSPPPPFLATPGPTSVPWMQWKRAFFNFLEALGGEELSKKRCRAILLNALGLEGQRVYYNLVPDTTDASSSKEGKEDGTDVFKDALSVLDIHFATTVNELMEWHRFRKRLQLPGEPIEAYSVALHELASCCNRGDASEKAVRYQPLEGTPSQHILPVRHIDPPAVPLEPQSTPGCIASESAPVDSSHGECNVSVLPSVHKQEDNFGAESSYRECDVSVLPSVPEEDGYFGADSSHGEIRCVCRAVGSRAGGQPS